MSRKIRILLAAAGVFLLAAAALWFVPGMKFSACLCIGAAAGCVLYAGLCHWAKKSKAGKVCKAVFLVGITAGLLSFLAVEAVLIRAGNLKPPPQTPCAVIVLGAGVNGKTPSLVLASRLDAAADYLSRIPPEVPVILSGGQGKGEDVTEAEAMYAYLTTHGIDGGRLHQEGRSTRTVENLAYSQALLEHLGVDLYQKNVAVVTSDFHMGRAYYLSNFTTGMTVFGVPASLPYPWLEFNYYTREYFALAKTVLSAVLN
ncbi:hypothetical protein OBV_22470 [Oscillibacter valericigenes Sjm18-20]|nr:hypothetical protein OBV_22470 [Oscillibacter valericigenes Sjm18-20]